jgi:hypothetical protein
MQEIISNISLVQILEYARYALMAFSGFLVISTFYTLSKAIKMRPKFVHDHAVPAMTLKRAELLEKWKQIKEKYEKGSVDESKVAIIQADALVDTILKNAGLEGEHMADRLMNIDKAELKSLDDIWTSHKIRNNVVHTDGFELSSDLSERAMRGYEKFLKELKIISHE